MENPPTQTPKCQLEHGNGPFGVQTPLKCQLEHGNGPFGVQVAKNEESNLDLKFRKQAFYCFQKYFAVKRFICIPVAEYF